MYIILNNKMFLDTKDLSKYIVDVDKLNTDKYKVICCPSSIFIPYFKNSKASIGSQDVSCYDSPNHTGDISAKYLNDLNVKYVIVNHFERCDNPSDVVDKINNLITYNITPILCINGNNQEEIKKEIDFIFDSINAYNDIIIAYESVNSIVSGVLDDINVINRNIDFIRNHMLDNYDLDVNIVYGGGVNMDNVSEIRKLTSIDGFLFGKESIYIDKINEVMEVLNNG